MKIRLLTALIATTCLSQTASADTLTTGSINNETTATADVLFNQPITLENTLTPVGGLKAGQKIPDDGIAIATGKLTIKEAGGAARLAIRRGKDKQTPDVAYARGHEGDDAYALEYMVVPDADFKDSITTSDGLFSVSNQDLTRLTYRVMGVQSGSKLTPKAGLYTISATGAVYNP